MFLCVGVCVQPNIIFQLHLNNEHVALYKRLDDKQKGWGTPLRSFLTHLQSLDHEDAPKEHMQF